MTVLTSRSASRTVNDVEPARQAAARRLIVVLIAAAWLYFLVQALLQFAEISHPVIFVLGLLSASAASMVLVFITDAARTPVPATTSVLTIALALVAAVAFVLGTAGPWHRFQDDPGQYLLAVVIGVLALYRPPREILATGIGAGIVLGVSALGSGASSRILGESLFQGVVLATPVVAITVGVAAFTRSIIRASERRLQVAAQWKSAEADRLCTEAGDLFNRVATSGHLTQSDVQHALALAGYLRAQSGPGPGESRLAWLVATLDQDGNCADPADAASALRPEQRTALAALLTSLSSQPRAGAPALTVVAETNESNVAVHVSIGVATEVLRWEESLAPSFVLLRAVGARPRHGLRGSTGIVDVTFPLA